jgi:hypothetical protein
VREQAWAKHTALVLTAVTMFVAVAVVAEWPWWEYAFLSDDSALSWLSSALLVANAAVAMTMTMSRTLPAVGGALLTAALTLLALDEQFLLHERWQDLVAESLRFLPTLVVGAGGIAFLVRYHTAIKSTAARALIAAGVAIGLLALWVDLGSPPALMARTEEAYEVFAESLFLCGLLEESRAQVHSHC